MVGKQCAATTSDNDSFPTSTEEHSTSVCAFELSTESACNEEPVSAHPLRNEAGRKRSTVKGPPEFSVSERPKDADVAQFTGVLHEHSWKTLSANIKEVALLLMLYTIQGIPMGLSTSVPFVLQGHVGYSELGVFSLVSLPFSCKVFWAPIVDAVYIPRIGRRKSWLIPVQITCAILMYVGGLSSTVDAWMGSAASTTGTTILSGRKANVTYLFMYFTALYFLMATQDVAVDGWSLTMLNEENRAFSSACNAIGQTLGFSIAHVGFLALRDPGTCNHWLRRSPSNEGIVTLGSFLRLWSYIVLFTTVVAGCFPERDETYTAVPPVEAEQERPANHTVPMETTHGILATYKLLFQLVFVKPILSLGFILLTCRVAFATIDAAAQLKLIEAGMTKEELAFFGPFLLPISLICPLLVGRVTCGPRPLRWFLRGWKLRVLMIFVWLGTLKLTHRVYSGLQPGVGPPLWFYPMLVLVSVLYGICTDIMFSAQMAFFARVSDPAIGGTYMTFLNTVGNLGNKWPTVVALMTLERFETLFGAYGFLLQTVFCSVLGLIWLAWGTSLIQQLEEYPPDQWRVIKHSSSATY